MTVFTVDTIDTVGTIDTVVIDALTDTAALWHSGLRVSLSSQAQTVDDDNTPRRVGLFPPNQAAPTHHADDARCVRLGTVDSTD